MEGEGSGDGQQWEQRTVSGRAEGGGALDAQSATVCNPGRGGRGSEERREEKQRGRSTSRELLGHRFLFEAAALLLPGSILTAGAAGGL